MPPRPQQPTAKAPIVEAGLFYQPCGAGAVAIVGTLNRLTQKAIGVGAVTMAGVLSTILTQFQAVGAGAIAIVGVLSSLLTQFQAVGSGAVTMVGTLGRLIKKTVGAGAITTAGTLSSLLTHFKAVGGGAMTIAGTLIAILVQIFSKPKYRLEIHDKTGALLYILKHPISGSYSMVLNEPHVLAIITPADETAASSLTVPNELWLRDMDTGLVLRKFILHFVETTR